MKLVLLFTLLAALVAVPLSANAESFYTIMVYVPVPQTVSGAPEGVIQTFEKWKKNTWWATEVVSVSVEKGLSVYFGIWIVYKTPNNPNPPPKPVQPTR